MQPHGEPEQGGRLDDGVSTFLNARSRNHAAAFRTLKNATEAEDIVQEAWLRWHHTERAVVRNAAAFLATTTRRLAINRAFEARTRHETPLEYWFADAADPGADPGTLTERGEALQTALLRVLERLLPAERAAYLLREAFNYRYEHLARVIRASEANRRQLVARARKHLMAGPRREVSSAELRRLKLAFVEATQHADMAGLEALLCTDIERATKRTRART